MKPLAILLTAIELISIVLMMILFSPIILIMWIKEKYEN